MPRDGTNFEGFQNSRRWFHEMMDELEREQKQDNDDENSKQDEEE